MANLRWYRKRSCLTLWSILIHSILWINLSSLLIIRAVDVARESTNNDKFTDLIINRIDLPEEKTKKIFSLAHLNDDHENLSVKWLGRGSSVMIILAKNNKAKKNDIKSTNVYISYDYGENFRKEDRLKLTDGSQPIINTFITSKLNNSHFIFTDIVNNHLFISEDYGQNYQTVKLNFSPKNVQMHSSIANLLIASDDNENTTLWASKDFGRTWKSIRNNVIKFQWASFEKLERIYVLVNSESMKSLEFSDDYFESHASNWRTNVKDFKICGNYIAYISSSLLLGSKEKIHHTTMYVSHNNSSFNMVLLENRTQLNGITDFQVVDCAENELIIAARSNNTKTDLYISNQKGSRLRKVLDNVVVSNNKTDIHKVAGLSNIYIANAYVDSGSSIISLITYDSGYSWKKINLTQIHSNEFNNSNCTNETCSLHFVQNALINQSKYPGIMSKEAAVGILVANGVIDENIKNSTKAKQVFETYVSRDAGKNWRKVANGSYLFNIADHGGLIVGVKHFPKSNATDSLIYSMDDGKTFNQLKFTNKSMRVYSLLTENGEKTSIFTIFGSLDGNAHSWVLVKVNLTSLYDKECDKNDLEYWQPHSNSRSSCFMGIKMKIQRRKEHVNCSYGENFERKKAPTFCECTREDYVCDSGFKESFENGTCLPLDLEEFLPPCDSKYATRTIIGGYTRIPGNQCLPPADSHYERSLVISCVTPQRGIFKTIFLSLLLTTMVFCAGYYGLNYLRNRQTRSTILNTHYNRRTDSAILLDDDGLGEEVHVRGFSDDVPMVIS